MSAEKNKIKKIIKEENKKFYKSFNILSSERIIQIALIQMRVNLNDNLIINKEDTDNFKIKTINFLISSINKILENFVNKYGDINYYLKREDHIKYILDRFDFQIVQTMNESKLDIDANEEDVIVDIFPYWFLGVHSYYYLKLISKHIKNLEGINSKNMVKGFVLSYSKFNKLLLIELRSDKILKEKKQ